MKNNINQIDCIEAITYYESENVKRTEYVFKPSIDEEEMHKIKKN